MRIYMDSCCLQRPLDDQTQPRIRIESEVVLTLFKAIQSGEIVLLSSEALEYETGRIPDEMRRNETMAILALGKEYLELNDVTVVIAESLEDSGINPMDAVHLALASLAKADFFISCDDKLLKKALEIKKLDCKVISVLSFIQEVIK